MDKPNGLYLITPEQGESFVETLAVGKFHGIGKATEKKMHHLGIKTGADLRQQPLNFLTQHFGKAGQYYYNISRAIDNRPVNNHRESKSIGVETTFQIDIKEYSEVLKHLQQLLIKALKKVNDKELKAHTLTIKVKYHDFVQITRSRTLGKVISESMDSLLIFNELLKDTEIGQRKVRLLGVTLSSFDNQQLLNYRQLDLFEQNTWN